MMYQLELVVSYENFPTIESVDYFFDVEIVHPCTTATLSIDTASVHLPDPAISMM